MGAGRPDGIDRRPVATLPSTNEIDPDWSPDGGQIVYAVTTWYTMTPHRMNADGSGRGDLDAEDHSSGVPSWQRLPPAKAQCLNGGWRNYGERFKNQGQCVAFVEHGTKR